MSDDERRLERDLAAALNPDPERTPPPERVAALRAQVEARGRGRAAEPTPVVELAPRRTRRREVLVGGIAASIGAVIGVGGALAASGDDGSGDGPPTEAIAFGGAPAGVSTDAALINHTWGTELMLDIRGLPAGRDYEVRYAGTDGTTSPAGSFRSVPDVVMKCRFNAAVLRADTAAIAVVDSEGTEILRADLT